jgi:hypothetical protein
MRMKSHYSLSKILRIISYSRQAYYKSKKRMNQKNIYKSIILSFAEDMIKLFPKMGIDKLYYSIKGKLEALSIKYGRDKLRLEQNRKERKNPYFIMFMKESQSL